MNKNDIIKYQKEVDNSIIEKQLKEEETNFCI